MELNHLSRPYQKLFATNANSSSFPSKLPTTTEPTNDGVFALNNAGVSQPQWLHILPYGLGSNNDVFDMKVIGWTHAGPFNPPSGTQSLWVPTTMGEFTCTISSTAIGVAGAYVLNTEMFADTIVVKSAALTPKMPGFDGAAAATFQSRITIYSPADDTVGWIILPVTGFEKFEVTFDQTTGTPTTNVLFRMF